MFNEQMLENLSKIPNVKELWKNEKSKYRIWILLFGMGIFTIFSLLLSSFILDLVNRSSIEAYLISNNEGINASNVENHFNMYFIATRVIQISILFFGLVYYLSSIYNSYKRKSFARISFASTSIISFGALFSLWGIIAFFTSGMTGNSINQTSGDLFRFINYFITIFVWISTVGQVVRIRNTFLVSERAERLRNDPRYQAFLNGNFQQQTQSFGGGFPFGFGPTYPNNSNNQTTNQQVNPNSQTKSNDNKSNEVDAKVSKQNANEAKLLKMNLEQLKEVARKLSISGYERMNKKTLIETILRITS